MAKQSPNDLSGECIGNGAELNLTDVSRPLFSNEWFFNKEVHEFATHHRWRPFHVDRFRAVRGRGFPDLAMFRKNDETGKFEMLVAELKKDADSEYGEGQEDWLEAFKQMGITTKVWRSDSQAHLTEMYDVIEKGTDGQDSVTKLPPLSSSPIPSNFRIVMGNIIEDIEGNEMSTGDKASLCRMVPGNPNNSAFWRLVSYRNMPRNLEIGKWGLIIQGIAIMSHAAHFAHDRTRPIGRTLFEGNSDSRSGAYYSEDRLARLLSARDATLHGLLSRLFRMLANGRCAFNWYEMAWFILNEGYNEEEANKSRIEIARAYYRAERQSAVKSDNQDN